MNRNTLAALSLTAALTLSLAACGGGTTGTAETPAPVSEYPTLHTVICNGKKSEGLYQKHFSQLPLRQIYLPSTSNANRTIKEEALFDRWITALRESLQEEPS